MGYLLLWAPQNHQVRPVGSGVGWGCHTGASVCVLSGTTVIPDFKRKKENIKKIDVMPSWARVPVGCFPGLSPLVLRNESPDTPIGWENLIFCASFPSPFELHGFRDRRAAWLLPSCVLAWVPGDRVSVLLGHWQSLEQLFFTLSTTSQFGVRKPLCSGGWVWNSFLILWQRQLCPMGVESGFTGDINGTVTPSVAMVLQTKKCSYSICQAHSFLALPWRKLQRKYTIKPREYGLRVCIYVCI